MNRVGIVAVALVVVASCAAERSDGTAALPRLPEGSAPLEPGTVAPADRSYVDALARNFEDGGRLVARVDAPASACLAEAWVSLLQPSALAAAGVPAERLADITLAELRDVGVSRRQAEAMMRSFAGCRVDHTTAFLDSLLLTSQITPAQRACLAESLPADLIDDVTVSALVDDQVDAALTAAYQRALDACPAS